MLYCIVLCCTVFYCTVLYCTVLYCTVLYCILLCRTVLYCTVLYCILLNNTILNCIIIFHHIYCNILYYTTLHSAILYHAIPYRNVLYLLSCPLQELCCGPTCLAEEIYYGGSPFNIADPSTHWCEPHQLFTWWKNNVERRTKFKVHQDDAAYKDGDARKTAR